MQGRRGHRKGDGRAASSGVDLGAITPLRDLHLLGSEGDSAANCPTAGHAGARHDSAGVCYAPPTHAAGVARGVPQAATEKHDFAAHSVTAEFLLLPCFLGKEPARGDQLSHAVLDRGGHAAQLPRPQMLNKDMSSSGDVMPLKPVVANSIVVVAEDARHRREKRLKRASRCGHEGVHVHLLQDVECADCTKTPTHHTQERGLRLNNRAFSRVPFLAHRTCLIAKRRAWRSDVTCTERENASASL